MILVGINTEWLNCVGSHKERRFFFTAKDIHEAATETLKSNWSTSWQNQRVVGGEFHDTETGKTWSVDAGGHTKRDYRKEPERQFRERWDCSEFEKVVDWDD